MFEFTSIWTRKHLNNLFHGKCVQQWLKQGLRWSQSIVQVLCLGQVLVLLTINLYQGDRWKWLNYICSSHPLGDWVEFQAPGYSFHSPGCCRVSGIKCRINSSLFLPVSLCLSNKIKRNKYLKKNFFGSLSIRDILFSTSIPNYQVVHNNYVCDWIHLKSMLWQAIWITYQSFFPQCPSSQWMI